MSAYYPDGVTGAEPEIAGTTTLEPQADERECRACGEWSIVEVEISGHGHTVIEFWTCPIPECGYEQQKDYDAEDYFADDARDDD